MMAKRRGECTLLTTHLAIAVLLLMVLSLNRHERFVALLFGVFIDVDHLLALPRFLADNSLSSVMTLSFEDPSGLPWKSLLHRPVGAFIVLPMAIGWRFMIPAAFWGIHIATDMFQQASSVYSVQLDVCLFAVVCSTIVAFDYLHVARSRGVQTPWEYVEDVGRRLRCLFMIRGSSYSEARG